MKDPRRTPIDGMRLATAAAVMSVLNPGLMRPGPASRDLFGRYDDLYGSPIRSHREPPRNRIIKEDLTSRPTPPLAPEKPLTKRQKRRLKGKKS